MTFYDIFASFGNVVKMSNLCSYFYPNDKPMLANCIILLLSWLLLKFSEKKDLSVLGLSPTLRRLGQLGIGLLLTIPFATAFHLTVAWLVQNPYHPHAGYMAKDLLKTIGWLANSVLYEDLLFRGALLYFLIQRIGASKAILASGIAFGIYHWFSYGVWGHPASMLVVFLTTGLAGTLMAMAFARSRSMYLPFGLHFGVDFVPMVLFSQSKAIGLQLLVKSYPVDPVSPGPVISLLVYIVYFSWFPLLTFLYLRRLHN
jgi:membrane protease YdiL (CAAX protease family)